MRVNDNRIHPVREWLQSLDAVTLIELIATREVDGTFEQTIGGVAYSVQVQWLHDEAQHRAQPFQGWLWDPAVFFERACWFHCLTLLLAFTLLDVGGPRWLLGVAFGLALVSFLFLWLLVRGLLRG